MATRLADHNLAVPQLGNAADAIVARSHHGQIVNFPVQRNLHRDGILAVTEVHGDNLPADLAQRAVAATQSIANGLDYVGVLCVEFFALSDGSLVVNEMAPRPHNSGHYTDLWFADADPVTLAVEPPWAKVLVNPGMRLYLYGKAEARRGRKMGHLTVTGQTFHIVREIAAQAEKALRPTNR